MAAVQTEGVNDDEKTGPSNEILASSADPSFDTEINILTKSNMNIFCFTGYPHQSAGNSDPKSICDQTNRQTTSDWASYGYQTKEDSNGIAYIQIDLKKAQYITKWAVSGYPGGKHRPVSTFSLRASNDGHSWSTIALCDASKWTADSHGTYPFRHIESVSDPGFYRFYQIYAVHFDNNHLLLMNVGLWSPQKMSLSQWNLKRECQHEITLWTTQHVTYWMSHYIKWSQNKEKEKGECLQSVIEYEVMGRDLVNADKETLKYLKIQNPLMQQRILDARDLVMSDPEIVHRVMAQCQKTSAMEMAQIVKELEMVKEEVEELKRNQNEVVNGELQFSQSWSNYAASPAEPHS